MYKYAPCIKSRISNLENNQLVIPVLIEMEPFFPSLRVTAAGVYLHDTGSVVLVLCVPGPYVVSAGERGGRN